MQLTLYTDYSLRVLLYLAMHRERLVTISEVTEAYDVSRNHMVKVVHNLGQIGLIQTIRGKSGGMRLAREPEEIIVGDVVKLTEPHIDLLECFDKKTNTCPLISACKLKSLLFQARRNFFDVLDQKTLADML